MKKFITITGILLTIIILVSGSVVATWSYAQYVYSSGRCTNPDNALYENDGNYASLGVGDPVPAIGYLILNLSSDGLGPNQEYRVWCDGGLNAEYFKVRIHTDDWAYSTQWETKSDSISYHDLQTGTEPDTTWIYVEFEGLSGVSDPIFGPEIDAVGFEI